MHGLSSTVLTSAAAVPCLTVAKAMLNDGQTVVYYLRMPCRCNSNFVVSACQRLLRIHDGQEQADKESAPAKDPSSE